MRLAVRQPLVVREQASASVDQIRDGVHVFFDLARARAEADVGRIAHSMALEDQAVAARETESLIEARAQE